MSNRKISQDTAKSTCSEESPDGPLPSGLPGGQTTDLFGQPLVPVRHFPSQASPHAAQRARAHVLCGALDELATQYARTAKRLGLPTPATYGRRYGDLSPSADLASSMESRLPALTPSSGGMLYEHRWKWSATPLGARIYRLRASARRTSGSGCGGWPTPTKGNADGSQMAKDASATGRRPDGSKATVSLNHVAQMSGWPTPSATDGSRGATPPSPRRTGRDLPAWAALASPAAGWATPRVTTNGGHGNPKRGADGKARLEDQVAGWATPTGRDHKDGTASLATNRVNYRLGMTVRLSVAPTEKRGQLNPEFVRWLMGFPEGWLD